MTTSIRLGAGALAARCSSTTTAGTKPLGAAATSVPARYALRQANSNEVEIPCRRAVAAPGATGKALLDDPQLRLARPNGAARVHPLEPLNLPTVLSPIHKDSPHRFAAPQDGLHRGDLEGFAGSQMVKE